jgi:troponin T
MSDEEYYEEEEVTSQTSKKGEGFLKAKKQKGELDEQLREYINEWRKQRGKEEEELKRLKEKQAKRKEIRAEQEKKLAQQKKEEEERLRKEEAEKKAKEAEEKKKRLEEAEMKRQAMMQAQKEKQQAAGGKGGGAKMQGGANVQDARREMTKTKEQLEEEKKISLSIRIKPLDVDAMDSDQLGAKAKELWDTIVRLETEKYDLEERQKRQDYDLKELKERQKQQLRQKAMKKGLDPEALTGKYPPKIRMYSKYERRTDTRTYEDRRKLYEGGWEVVRAEHLQALWKEKYDEWLKRPKTKLPKWFGERPGTKAGVTP